MFGMLVLVLGIVMGFEARDDLFRHTKDKELNERIASILRYCQPGTKGKPSIVEQHLFWKDIRVQDLVIVRNKETFPADLLLLASSNLSGVQ